MDSVSQFDSILELMKMMTSQQVEATKQWQLQLEISREQARLQVVNYEATLKAADLQAQQQMKLMHAHLEQFRQQIALPETRTAERQQRMLDKAAIVFSDSQTLLEQFLNNTIYWSYGYWYIFSL